MSWNWQACDSGLRGLAIEWLVSYVEKRPLGWRMLFFFPTAFPVLVGRIVRLSKFHFPSLTLQDMRWCIGMFGCARVKFLTKSVPDFINLTLECCLLLSKRSLLPLRGMCLCLCHIATVYNCSRHKRQQPFQWTQSPSWGRTFYFPQGMSLMLEVDDSEEKLKARSWVNDWLVKLGGLLFLHLFLTNLQVKTQMNHWLRFVVVIVVLLHSTWWASVVWVWIWLRHLAPEDVETAQRWRHVRYFVWTFSLSVCHKIESCPIPEHFTTRGPVLSSLIRLLPPALWTYCLKDYFVLMDSQSVTI